VDLKHLAGNYDWYTTSSQWAKAMDLKVCVGAGAVYALICIAYIMMRKPKGPTKPGEPRTKRPVDVLEVIHNLLLTVLSFAMLVGMGSSYLDVCLKHGWEQCLDVHRSGKEEYDLFNGTTGFWFMVFSASKFYELFDTYFHMKKGHPLLLLHWWHHATVPLLCAVHFMERSSSAWTGSIFNCFVHTFMYFHFMVAATGSKATAPIRSLITLLQLTQFATVIGHITWLYVQPGGFDRFPLTYLACYTIYASYFILFIKFFIDAYICKPKKDRSVKVTEPKTE
jgi:hypothetical protein